MDPKRNHNSDWQTSITNLLHDELKRNTINPTDQLKKMIIQLVLFSLL